MLHTTTRSLDFNQLTHTIRPIAAGFTTETRGEQWEEDDTDVDIVAVPGVGADPLLTWKQSNRQSARTWLEEDLVHQIPIARILFYDHGTLEKDDDLDVLATRFLKRLGSRDGARYSKGVSVLAGDSSLYSPPLIFLCHSTGGLVVQRALWKASRDGATRHLFTNCIGLVFFAVPYGGSDLFARPNFVTATRESSAPGSKPLRCYRNSLPKTFCNQFNEKSTTISDLRKDVTSLIAKHLNDKNNRLQLWSFYETLRTQFHALDPPSQYVVSKEAAEFASPDQYEAMSSDTDSDSEISLGKKRIISLPLPCNHYETASFERSHLEDYGRLDHYPARSAKVKLLHGLFDAVCGVFWPNDGLYRDDAIVEHRWFYRPSMVEPSNECNDLDLASFLDEKFEGLFEKRMLAKVQLQRTEKQNGQNSGASNAGNSLNGKTKEEVTSTVQDSGPVKPRVQSVGSAPKLGGARALARKKIRLKVNWDIHLETSKDAEDVARSADEKGLQSDTQERPESSLSTPLFGWTHLHYNHTQWVEKLLCKLAHSNRTNHPRGYCKAMQEEKYFALYRHTKQANTIHHRPHGRYLYSCCNFHQIEKSDEKSTAPATKSQDYWQVLHLPYLHWESYEMMEKRQLTISSRVRLKRESSISQHERHAISQQTEGAVFRKRQPTGSSKIDPDLVNKEKGPFKEVMKMIQRSSELKLIWNYLDDRLHCRRSLDQYMHPALEDTSVRDKDQVLYKATKERVLAVDQLWMWVLDDATVFTCFPPKEAENSLPGQDPKRTDTTPSAEGDLRARILEDVKSELIHDTDTHWDLAALVVRNAVAVMFESVDVRGRGLLGLIDGHVEKWDEKQAQYWFVLDKGKGPNVESDSGKEMERIFQDMRGYRELRDVEDELNMIDKVLEEQKTHIGCMSTAYKTDLGLGQSKGFRYLQDASSRLKQYQEQVKQMTDKVALGKQGYNDMIELRQKQISIDEAIAARKQSQAVTVFTVFTIFFLPLSFFTSLFGMNVRNWSGTEQNPSMHFILKLMLPLSFVIIISALVVAFRHSFQAYDPIRFCKVTFSDMVELVIIIFEAVGLRTIFTKVGTGISNVLEPLRSRLADAHKSLKAHRRARLESKVSKEQDKEDKSSAQRRGSGSAREDQHGTIRRKSPALSYGGDDAV